MDRSNTHELCIIATVILYFNFFKFFIFLSIITVIYYINMIALYIINVYSRMEFEIKNFITEMIDYNIMCNN